MARIKGVDIPNDKQVETSITYIYGIGRNLAKKIVKNLFLRKRRTGEPDGSGSSSPHCFLQTMVPMWRTIYVALLIILFF